MTKSELRNTIDQLKTKAAHLETQLQEMSDVPENVDLVAIEIVEDDPEPPRQLSFQI